MKRQALFLLLVAVVIGVSLYGFSGGEGESFFSRLIRGTVERRPQLARVELGAVQVEAEVAATPSARSQGLSGRDSLAADAGMLFIFEQPGPHAFWMQGMRFPIDIIWINDGTVVDVALEVPVPDGLPPLYTPNQFATQVLEVNAGWVAANHVTIGSPVTIDFDGFSPS
ncbi:MAG: DUF192 domain-containing protein [Candidatus Kerfeldbacteria bacterium]|nr:DUF192 domain-containing protein [Candidatus Kerfeldbacteria bacterium]